MSRWGGAYRRRHGELVRPWKRGRWIPRRLARETAPLPARLRQARLMVLAIVLMSVALAQAAHCEEPFEGVWGRLDGRLIRVPEGAPPAVLRSAAPYEPAPATRLQRKYTTTEPFVSKPSRMARALIYGLPVAGDAASTLWARSRGAVELNGSLQERPVMVAFKLAQAAALIWLDGILPEPWRTVLRVTAVTGYGYLSYRNWRVGVQSAALRRER